jgi:hypothetical protein
MSVLTVGIKIQVGRSLKSNRHIFTHAKSWRLHKSYTIYIPRKVIRIMYLLVSGVLKIINFSYVMSWRRGLVKLSPPSEL